MEENRGRGLEPVQAPALRRLVHEQLETLILDGTLRPGQRIVETELARSLGVSRGPIREALQLLERDSWVDLRPRHGAFVHEPTAKEIDDFFYIRRVLEVESARLAALNITSEGKETLMRCLEVGKHEAGDDDVESLNQPNVDLHEAIFRNSNNGALEQMMHALNKRTGWYVRILKKGRRRDGWTEHEAIVSAICTGDSEAAARLMALHVDRTRQVSKDLP